VVAVGHRRLNREAVYLAAVLAAGRPVALSHYPAARHNRLWRDHKVGPLHLIVPNRRNLSIPGITVHRSRTITDIDVITRDSIPVTSPTRTLVDLSPLLGDEPLRELFEQAEYLEVLDRGRLRQLLARCRGTKRLAALADYDPIPLSRTRSRLERIVLKACRTHSLPIPASNVPLLGYEVDLLWEDAKLVVEADGGQHEGERRARDNKRDAVLQRAGYLVRRYTEEALEDEAALVAELVELLSERSSSAGSASR
jgi:very-short-patch-repair endonuclease